MQPQRPVPARPVPAGKVRAFDCSYRPQRVRPLGRSTAEPDAGDNRLPPPLGPVRGQTASQPRAGQGQVCQAPARAGWQK